MGLHPLTSGPYRKDLAGVHDESFGALARGASRVLLREIRSRKGGLVVDLGCGSGILAERLTREGYPVLGVDVSAAMLRIARRRAPEARFRKESFPSTRIPSCVAVCGIGEVFNYLSDEGSSVDALKGLFRRIHRALTPGGVLLFDMAAPGRVPPPGALTRRFESRDADVWVTAEEDPKRRLLTRRIATYRRVGRVYRRSEEIHRLRLVEKSAVLRLLKDAGFRVEVLPGYGSFPLPPAVFAYLCRKR